MFNSPDIQAINKKLLLYQKLREQQEDLKQAELERIKIDLWWEEEKKKIVPWTPEYRAYMEAITFTPNEKTNERTIRSMTNTWKKLENR